MMSSELYTVADVAERLNLHPKTVLRCIREGRLRGTRIGKSYRIGRSDLEAFAGMVAGAVPARPAAQVTSVVDIADVPVEASERIASLLNAAAMSGDAATPPLHVHTFYQPGARALKIVLAGSPLDIAKLLQILDLQLRPGS